MSALEHGVCCQAWGDATDGLVRGLYGKLTDGLSSAFVKTVTGDSESPYEAIDKNLALM